MVIARRKTTRSVFLAMFSISQLIAQIPPSYANAGPQGSLYYTTSYTQQVVVGGLTPSGTGPFTYEAWFKTPVNLISTSPVQTIMGDRGGGAAGANSFDMTIQGNGTSGQLCVMSGVGTGAMCSTQNAIIANAWNHVAFVRNSSGGSAYLYLNGTQVSVETNAAYAWNLTSTAAYIGTKGDVCCGTDVAPFTGNISNVRIANFGMYSSSFTPSGPLTSDANTQLLLNTTNDANYLVNSGTNASVTISKNTITSATYLYPSTSSDGPFSSPTLTSLSVNSGNIAGGTTSLVSGTNLSSTTGVNVGGIAATSVVVNSATSISFVTPGHAAGTADVVVSTMLGNFTLSSAFTFTLSPNTITFPALAALTIGGTAPTLSATASSGLTVAYASSTTSVCTVAGSTITVLSTGTCTITASQAGNGTYAAAISVNQSFVVSAVSSKSADDASAKASQDKQDAIALAGIVSALGSIESSMGDLAALTLTRTACYKGKKTMKVLATKSCPKGYVLKKIKVVSGS